MNFSLKRNFIFIMGALFLLAGCAAIGNSKKDDYKFVRFTAIPMLEVSLRSFRPGPAKASNASEDSLNREGYVRIGSVESVRGVKECYGNDCKTYPPHDVDPETEILTKVPFWGGDLVTFSKINSPSSEKISNSEYIPGTRYLVTSAGNVWRYAPEFAKGHALVAAIEAAVEGDLNRLREVLSETQNANLPNEVGYTPLAAAVFSGRTSVVKLLFAHGVDPNALDYGSTALVGAVVRGNAEMVKVLVAGGANVNVEDKAGEPLLSIAKRYNYSDIVKILIEAGAIPLTQAQSAFVKAQHVRAVIETKYGEIELKFFIKEQPNHVMNFIRLAREGYYDGTIFSPAMKGEAWPGNRDMIMQRGDPGGHTFDAEENKYRLHSRGMLSSNRKSVSQFFIIVRPNDYTFLLDDENTVFGEVVRGMDVVDKIVSLPSYEKVEIMKITIVE